MAKDPYKSGLFKKNPYAKKADIASRLVVVLDSKLDNRELKLIPMISRAVRKFDVHELIFTDESEARPGNGVNRVAYGGFVEIESGGVLLAGDRLYWKGRCIGEIAGFDETHMPNHLNIVIKTDKFETGLELGFVNGEEIVFKQG
ncbi:MAG: hypothetical protein H0Z35_04245 [Thermoanaerobacteraceae bacterium]|nr:hypothetical protein [Thermoanaerobacteraceae bacterium]